MHVLWLIPDYFTFLVEELRALAPRVRRLSVLSQAAPPQQLAGVATVTIPPDCATAARLLMRGWHLVRAAGYGAWPRGPGDLPKLKRLARHNEVISDYVRRENVDVIHSHFAVPEGTGGWQAACGRPVIVTLRGVDVLCVPSVGYGFMRDRFYAANLQRALQRARVVTVASRTSHQAALRLCGDGGKVRLIPNGIDIARFGGKDPTAAQRVRQRHGIGQRALVLAAGNLVPNKAFDVLVRAVGQLRHEHPSVALMIVGEGPERPSLEALAASCGLRDGLVLTGRVPPQDMSAYYSAADVFAHPSLSEGFGNVVFEAMAMGCAVVATRTGIALDWIEHGRNGLLIDPGDAAQLAEALAAVLTRRDLCEQLGHAAAQTAKAGCSMADRAAAFASIYRECTCSWAGSAAGSTVASPLAARKQ